MALLLLVYLLLTATIPAFRTLSNLLAFLVLEVILVFAFKISSAFIHGRSAFIGLIVLVALIVISAFTIKGIPVADQHQGRIALCIISRHRLCRSDACRSHGRSRSLHTLHHRNIQYRLLYLIGLGVPPWLAFLMVIAIGAGIGFLNGVLTYRLQGQALILTLGMGFAVAGLVQILTSIGSAFSGNVFGPCHHG